MSGSGGAASGRKGAAYERELVDAIRGSGLAAMRLPASGAGTTGDRADIMVGRVEVLEGHVPNPLTELWLVELKCGKDPTFYFDEKEVDALRREAGRWGGRPLLGARSTRRAEPMAHFLVEPEDARRTDGGNYGVPVADMADIAFAVVWPDEEDPSVEVTDG